jgi:hypothetical protein
MSVRGDFLLSLIDYGTYDKPDYMTLLEIRDAIIQANYGPGDPEYPNLVGLCFVTSPLQFGAVFYIQTRDYTKKRSLGNK